MGVRTFKTEMPDGWFKCPNRLPTLGVSPGARLLWLDLTARSNETGNCWPSVTTICRDIGFERSAVKNYRRELVNNNLLRVEERQGRATVYYPLWPAEPSHAGDRVGGHVDDRVTPNPVTQVTGGGHVDDRGVVTCVTPEQDKENKIKRTRSPSASPPRDAVASRTVTSKTPTRKPTKSTNPDIKTALDFFKAKHQEQFGADYPCNHAKDSDLLGKMLKTCPIDQLQQYIQAFFSDNDQWLQNAGYSVGTFNTKLPRYVQQQARYKRSEKRPELPPVALTEKQLYGEF